MGEDPPHLPPPRLQPFIGFAKRGARALAAVRAVVDEDESFRSRVAAEVSEDAVGRAGWLWLHRPEGWEGELAALEAAEAQRAADAVEARADKGAARKLGAAREATAKAEASASAARKDAAEARKLLTAERRRRSAAEAEVARLTAERTDAVRQLKELEERAAERAAEVRALNEELRVAHAEPGVDRAALSADVVAAAVSAQALAAELAELRDRVVPAKKGRPSKGRSVVREPARPTRRRRASLPGGMLDDSPEAVAWLLRQPGAVLIVDGYNVSKAQWPDVPAAEQRDRLVAALRQMATRTGGRVDVVFDGAEGVSHAGRGTARDPVHIRFSDPDVEADDDIIALVSELASGVLVAVASSDNRVRAGAARGGANLVHARQLLEALRR